MLQLAPAYGAIGTLDALAGEVRVIAGGVERTVKSGLQINEGDTVKTGANAWAFFAMSDGASVTLRPNSQLRFDIYRYYPHGDATQNRCMMSLVRGAFRSITGLIGQSHPANYEIRMPTIQIGIRGTDHEPAYYPRPARGEQPDHAPGAYDKVNAGESYVRNVKGEVAISPGQTGFAREGGRGRPRLLRRMPAFYGLHAQLDSMIAAHREEFHRRFDAAVQLLPGRRDSYQPYASRRARQAGGDWSQRTESPS